MQPIHAKSSFTNMAKHINTSNILVNYLVAMKDKREHRKAFDKQK